MERGLRSFVLALMLLAIGAIAWAQGGATPPAAAPPAAAPLNYSIHTSDKYGFSIALPGGGTLLTPESPDWPWADLDETVVVTPEASETPAPAPATGKAQPGMKPGAAAPPVAPPAAPEMKEELKSGVAFHWYGSGPVKEVLVHCYTFKSPVMESTFSAFTGLLSKSFTDVNDAEDAARAKDKAAQVKEAVGVDKQLHSFGLGLVKPATTPNGSRWATLDIKDQRNAKSPVNYTILSTYGGARIYSVTLFYQGAPSQAVHDTGGAIINSLRAPDMMGPFGIEPIVMAPEMGMEAQPGMPAPKP